MPTLLIVDDEPSVCYGFRRAFGEMGVEVIGARSVADGLEQFRSRRPDVVVLDLQLPDGSGLDLFEAIREEAASVPVIFITAHGTTQTALSAMKHGAFDYLIKPVDLGRLTAILRRAFESARALQVAAVSAAPDPFDQIIGCSPVMQEMCKTIGRVAPQDVSVLIVGESGTGKELVAHTLHEHSRRANRPFLAINCAALPENLVESELFGHEPGAFTGADRTRIGKFEQADEGTLFLDEIGDMPLGVQAKMLRLLQEQTFERLGGRQTLRTQVRILAATNQDLEKRIEEGKFRHDLYYRLRVVSIHVPPLRERGEDVPALAQHFLRLYNKELGLSLRGFAPETMALFRGYSWPGNVRELQGAVKEAMLRASGHQLLPEFLPAYLLRRTRTGSSAERAEGGGLEVDALIDRFLAEGGGDLYDKVTREVERFLLTRILRQTRGHQAQASEVLGITRTTLRNKLRELGIVLDKVVSGDGGSEAEAG
jgi:two-component system nitrogen regulation response regulator GlnG